MENMLLKTLETVISHFWIITLTLILSSVLKKILYVWIEFKKIEIQHKDTIKIGVNAIDGSKIIEITSSNIKLKELENLSDKKLLEIDFNDNKKAS